MTDICMALDQSVSPHTGVRTIQNTGVFWQAVFQPPRPYSLFLEHGSAAKTLISHPHNTVSYAGYCFSKIQKVGQKYRDKTTFSRLKLDVNPFFAAKNPALFVTSRL